MFRPADLKALPRLATTWFSCGWATWQRASNNDAGIASAAIAFFSLLGMVPALSAIGLVCGWLAGPPDVLKAFSTLCNFLPRETRLFVLKQLAEALAGGGRDGIVALATTLGFGLYGLMNAANALIDGLNLAYRLPEGRGWFGRTAVAAAMALAGALAVVGLIAALLIAGRVGAGIIVIHRAIVFLTLPAILVFSVWLMTLVYRFAPSRKADQRHRVWPGAIAGIIMSLAASTGFALYAAHLANFTATYGVLASVAPILLYLQLGSYVILLGGALNAELSGADQT